jgi:hypothetical protein
MQRDRTVGIERVHIRLRARGVPVTTRTDSNDKRRQQQQQPVAAAALARTLIKSFSENTERICSESS